MFEHLTLKYDLQISATSVDKPKTSFQKRVDALETIVLMLSGPCKLLRKFGRKIHREGQQCSQDDPFIKKQHSGTSTNNVWSP